MRIGVDVDGVMRDFHGKLIEVVARERPDLTILPKEEWNWDLDHNIHGEISEEDLRRFIFNQHAKEIYREAEMFPGTRKAFNKLLELPQHEIVIVSSQSRDNMSHTLYWLGKNDINANEVILTRNKNLAKCDILLDDALHNLKSAPRCIALTRPWNRTWAGERCESLLAFWKIVKDLE